MSAAGIQRQIGSSGDTGNQTFLAFILLCIGVLLCSSVRAADT